MFIYTILNTSWATTFKLWNAHRNLCRQKKWLKLYNIITWLLTKDDLKGGMTNQFNGYRDHTSDISLLVRLLWFWPVEIKAFRPASHTSASTLSLQIYGIGTIKDNQFGGRSVKQILHQISHWFEIKDRSKELLSLTRSRDLSPLLYKSENDKYSFSGRRYLLKTGCNDKLASLALTTFCLVRNWTKTPSAIII